jgi:hypothetical protein
MTPKSGDRFSDQIMRKPERMTPKSGDRFSDQVMRQKKRVARKSVKASSQLREA